MDREQLKYARQRANEIYSTKLNSLNEQFYSPGKTLTSQEKLEALKAGKFTVSDIPVTQRRRDYYGDPSWTNYVVFTDETEATTDAEGLKKAQTDLRTKFNKMMDELMLGDNDEALKLLREFEAA